MSATTIQDFSIRQHDLKLAAHVFRAINHPLRQKMLLYMHKEGRVNVTRLYTHLKLEQSVASQHLAILRGGSFVVTQREGKEIYYAVNYERVQQAQDLARELTTQE